jgi:hypothetical protein
VTQGEAPGAANGYTVREAGGDLGWSVAIVDPSGLEVWTRACHGETDARTFASTVRQHIYWLSETKFREYYRLSQPPAPASPGSQEGG